MLPKNADSSCQWCGRNQDHDRQHCPARSATCRKCGKKGHYQAVCKSSAKVSGVNTEDAFIGALDNDQPKDPWKVNLKLNGQSVTFNIDTGAEVTVISSSVWRKIGSPTLQKADKSLHCPDKHTLDVQGMFEAVLKSSSNQTNATIYVVRNLQTQLLGRPSIEGLSLVSRVASIKSFDPVAEFPSLFSGLGCLEGDYTISLKKDAKPYTVSTPRRVAIPLQKRVHEELQRMEQLGVIIPVTTPTEWCAGMVVVPKSNNKVRICVDLTHLNESVQRERHLLPAVDQTLAQLAGAKIFSKIDANSGFWQVPLAPESALLTTFITPFGRYCFQRLPFGISSAPEHFQRRMQEILEGVQGVVCQMDDILVHGQSQQEHDQTLRVVLEKLKKAGVTLNREKCEFSCESVTFLGHLIDSSGIRPDPSKVEAILKFKQPTQVADIRRFLGMVNQMSKFAPHLADITQPLRELLTKNSQWIWGEPQETAFTKVKQLLTSSPVLTLYDPNLESTVSADASSFGLGAVLLQKQKTNEMKPVAYISRSMTAAEQRYAQIEKEALALTWACERFSDYLLGTQFHVQTDHKPLVPLLSHKRLEELPIRIQRFRLRMMRYSFTISHVPGVDLVIADALSRSPLSAPTQADRDLHKETDVFINLVIENLPATDKRLEEIKKAQQSDKECQLIAKYCQSGWPVKHKTPLYMRKYLPVSAEISIQQGLLLRGSRILVPQSLRQDILARIHDGHQGITKCRERARQVVWWPGLSKELEKTVQNCVVCCKEQIQRAEPLKPSPLPDLPWQKVGTDLFEWKKKMYILVVDYYSRYIEIALLNNETASEVITKMKSIFARHGIPESVVSDCGPQFMSEAFEKFSEDYKFRHVTSSPYFPQANGEAERAVRTVKDLLKKSEDPYLALLAYRTTPVLGGKYSPSQLLMNRQLKSTIPTTVSHRTPEIPNPDQVREKDKENKLTQKKNHDQHKGARELPELQPGTTVWIPSRKQQATVEEEVAPRSFQVTTDDGASYRRNRRDLIELPSSEPTEETVSKSDSSQSEDTSVRNSDTNTRTSQDPPPLRRSNRISHPPVRFGQEHSN